MVELWSLSPCHSRHLLEKLEVEVAGGGIKLTKPRSTRGMTSRKTSSASEAPAYRPSGFRSDSSPFSLFRVGEWMRHDQLAEVQGSRRGEVLDRRCVDRSRVDGARHAVWLGQWREQNCFEWSQPFMWTVNLSDFLVGLHAANLSPVLSGPKLQHVHGSV